MLQTLIAKTIGLVRTIAPLLLGAMLPVLSLLASADAEAQTEFTPPQITIHIKANLTREASRPLPSYNWRELGLRFTREQILASVTTCVEKNRLPDTETLACPDHVAQAAQPATFELDDEVSRTSGLCSQMGGDVKLEKQQEVCSNIDASGTFCFVGSREVFPCKGFYRRVLRCNSFNRPARNPFVCARPCEDRHFACGNGCWSGNLVQATRILSVAPEYSGVVFSAATTLTVGDVRFTSLTPGITADKSPFSSVAYGAVANVFAPSLPAGRAHAATLRAEFFCPELSGEHSAHAEWSFTITALAHPPTTTLYYESGAGTGDDGGKLTIDGIGEALYLASYEGSIIRSGTGKISIAVPRPESGQTRTINAVATSGEFGGNILMTAIAEFRHPFHSDLGEGHCKVPDNQAQVRRNEGCPDSGYCEALDKPMFDALKTQDGIKSDSDLCSALRNGADVNVLDDGVYPMAIAATLDRVAIGEVLTLSGATIHSDAAEYGDALNYAAYAGSEKFARWLIVTVGASVNAQSGSGNKYAPVHMLGLRNFGDAGDSAAVARLLTLHNADLDAATDFDLGDGHPPLSYRYVSFLTNPRLSGEPDYRALSVLVSAGVNLAYGHPSGEEDAFLYPLDRAAKHNLAEVARVMLTRGNGIVNVVNDNGTTPIFHARTLEMVNLLIAAGANVNLIARTSPDPTTPLDAILNDYYPGHRDENLLQAISRLKRSGEAQCLATYSNYRPAAVVDLCPNEVLCREPEYPHYDSRCTLACPTCGNECPPGYGSVEWFCPVDNPDIRDSSGGVDDAVWEGEKLICQDNAKSQLSCLPR